MNAQDIFFQTYSTTWINKVHALNYFPVSVIGEDRREI